MMMMICFCLGTVSRSRQFKQGWRQTRPGDQETRAEQDKERCYALCAMLQHWTVEEESVKPAMWRRLVSIRRPETLSAKKGCVQKEKNMCKEIECARDNAVQRNRVEGSERDTSRDWEWYAAPTAADSTKARASLASSKYQNKCFQEILILQDIRYFNFEHKALD